MKKRLFILSLVLMLTFTFTGCEIGKSDDSGDSSDGAASKEEAKKIEFADAADQITYAQLNAFKLKGMGIKAKVGVDGDLTPYIEGLVGGGEENQKYIDFLNEFLSDTELGYDIKYKKAGEGKMPNFEIGYGIDYKDDVLMNFIGSLNDKNVGMSTSVIPEKGFAINYKKLIEKEDADSMKVLEAALSLDLEKYIDIILGGKSAYDFYNEDLTSVKEVYAKYLNENATKTDTTSIERDGKEIAVTEYKIVYNYDKAIQLNKDLLEAIKKDEKIVDLILDRSDLILDEILESKDYELFGATKEDIQKAKGEIAKAKHDNILNEHWEEAIDLVIEAYKEQQAMVGADEVKDFIDGANIEYYIRINEANILDSAMMNATIKDADGKNPLKVEANIIVLNADEMEFIDTSKFLDLTDYVDADYEAKSQYFVNNKEAFEYVKEYMLDAVNYVLEGENVNKIYDLMKKHGMKMEKNMMKNQLEQFKKTIEEITPEIMSMMM